MNRSPEAELSRFIWQTRYRNPDAEPAENDIVDTWKRVAHAAAAIERNPALWTERFFTALRDFRFLPGGRILAAAGTTRNLTLSNCFVMGPIEDSIEGVFEVLKETALTIQQGGGVGMDFSTLRPRGSQARTSGAVASGPVSFMHVWDAMCETMLSTGARRGAMMGTLRCDHPDIEHFIDARRAPDGLRNFNLSVQVTEPFMQAVMGDSEWPLVFPDREGSLERAWSGSTAPVRCRVHRVVRARELWQRLCDCAYDCGEPGVLFIDRINSDNNLAYCEQLATTNPCAEEPLPPYGACNLGSINLVAFVLDPFAPTARLDEESLRDTARVAVRFLDNVIDITRFPLFRQREQAHRTRRIGLGITGFADALAILGVRYDSEPARASAARVMRVIRDAAYEASVDLALERGAFPALDTAAYLARPFIQGLPEQIRSGIGRHGIRNSHLMAIAPAGSISLLAHNVSGGIEPIFGIETLRRVLSAEGTYRNFHVTDRAYAIWRAQRQERESKPAALVDAERIAPLDHLLMQAAVTPYVDGSIAKIIALPRNFDRGGVAEIFEAAHVLRLKGCSVFRAGARYSALKNAGAQDAAREAAAAEHCCSTGRASD